MKSILLALSLIFLVFTSEAQNDSTKFSFINNERIKYSIVLMACNSCAPIKNIGDRVIINLSKEEKDVIKKMRYSDWKYLLNDNKSDWAANLILYSLYDKDAFLLSQYNKRQLWVEYLKNDDLKFWRKNLHYK